MKQKQKKPVKHVEPRPVVAKPGVPLWMWGKLVALVLVPVAILSGVYWGWEYIWPSRTAQDRLARLAQKDKEPPKLNPSELPGPAPEGMIWVPGGEFWMGFEEEDNAVPVHKVYVDGFWMDKTEVTNYDWAKFVAETKYVTVAEKKPDPKDFPDADPDDLKDPFSLVFSKPKFRIQNALLAQKEHLWWKIAKHASWKQPEGPDSSIAAKDKEPVVHICWDDAVAYCKWAGKRLPTEAEWEFAARGGLDRQPYVWGDDL
jgi:sulfatase modifying factor 1